AISRSWHSTTERRTWFVESNRSSLDFMIARGPDNDPAFAPNYQYHDYRRYDSMNPVTRHWFPFPPMRFEQSTSPVYPNNSWQLTIAYWLLLPPTLVLPAIAFVRHRRRRRRETSNLCPTCGYDLRASPERCPECGTANPRG